MEKEEILENITKSISDRLKVPIITTYLCVLIVYNWDILFYLFIENQPANIKIEFIKEHYHSVYLERIAICLGISICLIIIFTILNTFINFCLKWFYRKDKQITSEIESFEQIDNITQQLSKSIEEIKTLKSKNDSLRTVNDDLVAKTVKFKTSEISEKDYSDLIAHLNRQPNKEKYIYSLFELIKKLKKDEKIALTSIYSSATYEKEMRQLISIIFERHLASAARLFNTDRGSAYDALSLGTSFKDFLKIEDL